MKIKNFFRKIKFAFQRVKRGFSDYDVWDIDMWFCKTVPAMLERLAETTHGYPHQFWQAYNIDVANGAMTTHEADEAAYKNWQMTLYQMADALREAHECTRKKSNPYEHAYFDELTKGGKVNLKTASSDIANAYLQHEIELQTYSERKLEEGLNLFKENFYNLWD